MQCPLCAVKVRSDRYDGHIKRVHKNQVAPTKDQHKSPPSAATSLPVQVRLVSNLPNQLASRAPNASLRRSPADAVLAKPGRRRCEVCDVILFGTNYDRHQQMMHPSWNATKSEQNNAVVLTVQGLAGSVAKLTLGAILQLPQHTITTSVSGKVVTSRGVLLFDVLQKVINPTGELYRCLASWYFVVAQSVNGSRAVFSWAELDPSITAQAVYLVGETKKHEPSDTRENMYLLVSNEKRPLRSLRQVLSLKVMQTL
jgi:hypothetical protein